MPRYFIPIVTGIALGTLARYLMLKVDYRQYPSYPHGVVTHLSLGFIAAVLGSVAVPALMEKEFTAVSFLALAAQQFREVRSSERQMLFSLDESELVQRGPDYIEGIARVFESRNYLVILTALIVSTVTLFTNILFGFIASLIAVLASNRLMTGRRIGDIAKVRPAEVRFEGANVFVEDIHIMNLGRKETRKTVLERGLGVILEPINDNERETLANNGQRMAIAHDAASQLGIYKDVDTPEFTPLVRRSVDTGRIGMLILPIEKDMEFLITAIKGVPVLESAVGKPLKSRAGKMAAD
ncbi:MAG: hypothetical protein CVU88_03405 [Firmicutes bacterium HGW-Firmicutes-13]|nr:MAG: hypothetical protein CVU88_03405 [Firmicutes bacterium HGW-Firmicutes-13]